MDAVYIYRHSPYDDFEIRYSLRSLEQNAPYIKKVWIYGDRPRFLVSDKSIVEHVPHEYTARMLGVKTPVVSFCMLMVLSSLIPELDFEYLLWSDDHFLLKDYPAEEARKTRYVQNMAAIERPAGRSLTLWRDALWRTIDKLVKLGYTGYNFEAHVPKYLTKKRVFDAYCEFRPYISEDRFFGFSGPSAIYNHVFKSEGMRHGDLTQLSGEKQFYGFWRSKPSYDEVSRGSFGKTFLNFDDAAFSEGIKQFLMERFPQPSRFERADDRIVGPYRPPAILMPACAQQAQPSAQDAHAILSRISALVEKLESEPEGRGLAAAPAHAS